MAGRLHDKVILITGAGSGIGRATALACAREGGRIAVADINAAGGNESVQLIQDTGSEAAYLPVDVVDAASVEALVRGTIERLGRLDGAFNNAGIEGTQATVGRYSEEEWDRVVDIDLKGVFLCLRQEINQMLEQGTGGAIVNTASVAGLVGIATGPAYVAAKHGVAGLTKSAALAYARRNIRVNAVCPGVIHTPMLDRIVGERPRAQDALLSEQPIGRLGRPEEIAEAVVWLLSDAASLVTGVLLPVDGGYIAH